MSRAIQESRFACGVGGYQTRGKEAVRIWVEITKDGSDIEAVHKEGGTTRSVSVLE